MEELYKQMLNHLDEAVIMITLEQKIIYLNKKAEILFQIKKENVIQKTIFDSFGHINSAGVIWNAIKQGVEIEKLDYKIEINKNERIFRITTRFLTKENKHEAIMLFATDITEEKRKEGQVQQEKRDLNIKFYEIFNSANDIFMLTKSINGKHYFIDVNKKGLEVLEYTKDEFLFLDQMAIVSNDSLSKIPNLKKSLKQGKTPPVEWSCKTKSGKIIPLEIVITRIPIGGEDIYLTVARDIRERKEAEKQIVESHSFIMTLINSLQKGFAVLENGKTTIVNEALYKIYRVDPQHENLTGLTINEFLDKVGKVYKEPEIVLERLKSISSKERLVLNHEKELADGRTLEYDFIPVMVKDQIKSHIWLIRDVTYRVETENYLKKARNEAERANRAKNAFLSRMSHDLRTPLNSIIGFSQILLESEDLSYLIGHKPKIKRVLNSGEHLLSLIKDMLDFSSIESGILHLEENSVNVKSTLVESVRTIQKEAAEKEILLDITPFSSNIFIKIDQVRFKQILLNLLSNAIKYTPEKGSVKIHIKVENSHVTISIIDSGCGISKDELNKVFLPMYRGTNRKDIEGTGLGLAIVAELTTKMNGTYGVKSQEGEGSTFWVSFPICKEISGQQEDITAQYMLDNDDYKILYIEDNLDNFYLMEEIIARLNVNIKLVQAIDGKSGLLAIDSQHFDLILLDMNLPDTTGEELLKKLKMDVSYSKIPIMVLSANAIKEQIENAFLLGCSEYITKPIKIKEFLDILQSYIRGDKKFT
jgi:PAS domain S-box-containing protein